MKTLEQIGAIRTDLIPWHEIPLLVGSVPCGEPMLVKALVDKNGRPRSIATMPGFRKGQKPGNHGKIYDAVHLTVGEIDMMIVGRSRTSASGKRDRSLMSWERDEEMER